MGTRRWWQRPRLRTDEEEQHERKVSWLELFYDLVFVVVISELTSYLSGHVSLGGVLGFVLHPRALAFRSLGRRAVRRSVHAGDDPGLAGASPAVQFEAARALRALRHHRAGRDHSQGGAGRGPY